MCLGSCGLDVVVNALVLFWVTSGSSSSSAPPSQVPRASQTALSAEERARRASVRPPPLVLKMRPATADSVAKLDASNSGFLEGTPTARQGQNVSFVLNSPTLASPQAVETDAFSAPRRSRSRASRAGSGVWTGLVKLLGSGGQRERERAADLGLQVKLFVIKPVDKREADGVGLDYGDKRV